MIIMKANQETPSLLSRRMASEMRKEWIGGATQMTKPLPDLEQYWSRPLEQLMASLETSSGGLNAAEAAARIAVYGHNLLKPKESQTPLKLFVRQFQSPIILLLLFATALSALLKDWIDALIIAVIVIGSALLSFVQENSASNAIQKLRQQITLKVTALRDGQPQPVPAEEIVPGDIVLLSAGSLVPADGILFDEKDFFVNQAALTGETFPVEKRAGTVTAQAGLTERINMVFMGTNVRSGSAKMLVVQTGLNTVFGQLAGRLGVRPPETEFERGIRHLGYLLAEVTMFLVLAVFAINVFFREPVLDSLLFSLALAVGLTPQLLPAIININLSKGSQRMAQRGVIVRRLEAIENFGSADILCTDKTGTITQGVMELNGAMDAAGNPSQTVLLYASLNAQYQTGLPNPLDQAILAKSRQSAIDTGPYQKVDEIPFDFIRKRLSVIVVDNHEPKALPLMITKGALDNILPLCSQIREENRILSLDPQAVNQIQARFETWSAQGFRVLGIASRRVTQKTVYEREDEENLTFEGFLLFFDPPKQDVKNTIEKLSGLGVHLKIITGDNRLVAKHIAGELGLKVNFILTGSDMEQMNNDALRHAVENAQLFAEIDPNEKERIILALKKNGHVVGYMGDGINDAPSLHAADVSISVDTAVDVAKEAANFVLLEADLNVLIEGIIEGRKTFANSLKYVFMATSANFGNMFSVAGASLFLPFLPMLPKQILLINFLTDLPEMTIATDNVDPVLIEKPQRWNIGFIRRFMIVFGILSSVFDYLTFAVLILLLTPGRHLLFLNAASFTLQTPAGQVLFHTAWFLESIFSAVLVMLVLRTRLPFVKSKPSRPMIITAAGVLILTLLVPFSPLATALGFMELPSSLLLTLGLIVAAYLVSAEIAKQWFYRKLR